jgi:hypothetical protein
VWHRVLPFLLPATWVAAAPLPQGSSSAAIADEVEFARRLAADLGYADLATEVLEGLRRLPALSSEDREEIAAVSCEVLKKAAEREGDRVKRLELQNAAVRAYLQFLEKHSASPRVRDARLDLAEISAFRGQFLSEEVQAIDGGLRPPTPGIEKSLESLLKEDPSRKPAEDASLREQLVAAADTTFRTAIRAANELTEDLQQIPPDERTETQRLAFYRAWFAKGKGYYDWGLCFPVGKFEREDYLLRAKDELERLTFEVGEGTRAGLLSYIHVGSALYGLTEGGPRASEAEEKTRRRYLGEGLDYARYVIDNALPKDPDARRELEREEGEGGVEERRDLVEQAFSVEIHYLVREAETGGDPRAAGQMGERARALLEWQKAQGRPPSKPYGHLALLEAARAFLVEGNGSEALRIAQRVSRENPKTTLALRAQLLIGDVLRRFPKADPEILLEAAKGEYVQERYPEAVAGLKRVLANLDDEADRARFGGSACYYLGASFERMGRPYEAAMAYRRGVASHSDDAENIEKLAQGFHRAATEIRRTPEARADAAVDALYREAQESLKEWTTGAAKEKTLWIQALGLQAEEKFDEAIALLRQIAKGSEWYEKALVRIAVLEQKKGKDAEAERLFLGYLEGYVRNPDNAVSGRALETRRREAMSEAEFYLALGRFNRADGLEEGPQRGAAFAELAKSLETYLDRYPDQTAFHPRIYYVRVVALLEAGNLAGAKALHNEMRSKYPEDRFTGGAAVRIFAVLDDQVETARAALKAAIEAKDEGAAGAARTQLEAALLEAAEYVALYNETSTPNFGNWRKESTLWVELGIRGKVEWSRAEASLRKILERFGSDASVKEDLLFVRKDLGQAFLEQRRPADAEQVLREVRAAEDPAKRSKEVQVLLARALGGTVVETASEGIVEIPGTGEQDPKKYEEAETLWREILASTQKWTSCEFYEYLFDSCTMLHRWSNHNPPKKSQLRASLEALEANDPTLGAQTCGDRKIERKFRWLMARAR